MHIEFNLKMLRRRAAVRSLPTNARAPLLFFLLSQHFKGHHHHDVDGLASVYNKWMFASTE